MHVARNRFCSNIRSKTTYIQSACSMPTEEKAELDFRHLALNGYYLPKIVCAKRYR